MFLEACRPDQTGVPDWDEGCCVGVRGVCGMWESDDWTRGRVQSLGVGGAVHRLQGNEERAASSATAVLEKRRDLGSCITDPIAI